MYGMTQETNNRNIPDGLTETLLLGTMRNSISSLTALWRYVMAAMHSASIEGTPKTGPHTCSSSITDYRPDLVPVVVDEMRLMMKSLF